MKQNILKIVIIGMVGLAQTVAADSFTDDDINQSFHPYADWTPTADGYSPGVVIDQNNVDQYQAILDEALFKFVKDGSVTIRRDETTDFPLSEDYIEATRQYAGDVSLAENGTLNNFVASSQSYQSRFAAGFGTNFTVRAGKPYQANVAADGTFPGP